MMTFLQNVALWSLALLSLAGCHTAAPRQWQWSPAGAGLPRRAIVTAVAVDPLNPNRLWAGYYASGGLAFSVDRGRTWHADTAAGLAGNPVFDLLILPQTGTVWAATRDGLMRRAAGAANWQPATKGLPPAAAFALAADATGRVYAGLDGAGVVAQARNGPAWESLAGNNKELASAAVLSLAVSARGRQLYAGTGGQGIFASRDGGQTWAGAYPGRYVPAVALNPANPSVAVASLRDRLVRSVDGGQLWHTLPVAWAAEEVVMLVWPSGGPLAAGTGRGRLYLSFDGGDSWLPAGDGLPDGSSILALAIDPEQRLIAGSWTGLYASNNLGQSWFPLPDGPGAPQPHTLLNTGNRLLLGGRSGLFAWQPEQGQWVAEEGLQGNSVLSLAAAPSGLLYAGTSRGLYRSHNHGQSWEPLPSLAVGIPALAVDPTRSNHIYMLAAWERVYESWDGGQNWQARWDGLGSVAEAVSLAVDPQQPVAYVGTEAGFFKSNNGGPWQWLLPSLVEQSILALAIQPVPAELGTGVVLYIGTTRGAYRSLDRGQTVQGREPEGGWGRGLEDVSVTAFLFDPHDPRRLYAGTAYAGVYQSVDWGFTWQPVGPAGMDGQVVEAMAWGPEGDLFVAATGGVWRGVAGHPESANGRN